MGKLLGSEAGEACEYEPEGRAIPGTDQQQRLEGLALTLTEPPDADPHVRWCERRALAPPSYSIVILLISLLRVKENYASSQFRVLYLLSRILYGERYRLNCCRPLPASYPVRLQNPYFHP